MRVYVGSDNPLKAEAVANVFRKVFKSEIIVELVDINLEIPKQPFDDETLRGAIERAKRALKDADYGVGIEGGIIQFGSWLLAQGYRLLAKSRKPKATSQKPVSFSVQFCAIIDKAGRLTVGHSSGFVLPDRVITKLKQGQTLGHVMEELSGLKGIGKSTGAIGFLSKGLLDRRELTEQAVLMALIPRIRPELYLSEQSP